MKDAAKDDLAIETVLEDLKQAGQQMTAEEVQQQKISFIMGSLSENSGITRDFVEAELNRLNHT